MYVCIMERVTEVIAIKKSGKLYRVCLEQVRGRRWRQKVYT